MSLIFGSFFWRSAPIDPLVPPSVPPPCMHLYLVTPTLGRRTVLPGCRSVLPGAGGHCACHACSLAQLQPDLMRGDRRRDVRHPKVDPSGCKVLRQQRRPWWRRLGCDRRVRPCSAFAWGFPPPLFPLDRDLSNYNRSAVCDRSHVCGCGGGKCVLYGCRWTLLVAFTVLQMGDWRLRFCWDSLTWTDGAM